MNIKKVAVLGSGVMGSQIAALLAGCGLDVLLLDILPLERPSSAEQAAGLTEDAPAWRNKIAASGVERLKKLKPSPLFRRGDIKRIQVGNLDDHLELLRDKDWILEVVIERLAIKQSIYEKLESVLGPQTIVTSNTSGISVEKLMNGRSAQLRRSFCVTHFFNPPRYLKLLELVPGPDTHPEVLAEMKKIGEEVLGKGIVNAKDTPNFIANRIGVYHFLDVMHLADEQGWPLEAVDAVLGTATAHPKSAVFRTADIVGLDTLTLVAETVMKNCPHDEQLQRLRIPQYIHKMITKGWIGQKSKQGFYQKDKDTKSIKVIDPATLDYRPKAKFNAPSVRASRSLDNVAERLKAVVFAKDPAGEIAWPAMSRVLVYAAHRIPEISDDILQIDRAMRWGFGWELGPFEMWDALGVEEVVSRLQQEKIKIPAIVQQLLGAGQKSFYSWNGNRRVYFDVEQKKYVPEINSEQNISLLHLKSKKSKIIEQNAGATLIDADDGVMICEFHTKMNAIDGDIIEMIGKSVERVEADGRGLLIANQGVNFCAGANLLLIVMAAQQKRWDEIEKMIRSFQGVMQQVRFSAKPVMAAPFGMVLGGGFEVALAANRRVLAAESYMGLVEVGAGVIPAGCGCKNMLIRYEDKACSEHNPKDQLWFSPRDGGPFPKVRQAFEKIGTAFVATSAFEAQEAVFILPEDKIVMDKEKLLFTAKQELIAWADHYQAPARREKILLPGRGGKMALINALQDWKKLGKITAHDEVVAEKLAHVLSGGDMSCVHLTNEEHILDLECEAFLSLCGEEKSQARMMSLLQTGRPLRN